MAQSIDERIGGRLKSVRKNLGLTLQEVANRIGFKSYQILSDIEKGKRPIKVSELSTLSKQYFRDSWFFLSEEEPEAASLCFAWRKPEESPGTTELEAKIRQTLEDLALIECALGEQRDNKVLQWTVKETELTYKFVEQQAQELIDSYNLGFRPSVNLSRLVESQLGIRLLCLDMQDYASAVTVDGQYGLTILINSTDAPHRRNFDLAHELFHVLTRAVYPIMSLHTLQTDVGEMVEKLANAFAASLLMPITPLREEFLKRVKNQKIAYIDLIEIALDFGVSTQALLWRLFGLRLMTRVQVENVLNSNGFQKKNMSARSGHNWQGLEYSESSVALGIKAVEKAVISRGKFCKIFGIKRNEVEDFIARYGFTEGTGDGQHVELDNP